jgi:hypothetical protein
LLELRDALLKALSWVAAQNFVHTIRSIRCTPAMAAGIVRKPWTVGMLLTA